MSEAEALLTAHSPLLCSGPRMTSGPGLPWQQTVQGEPAGGVAVPSFQPWPRRAAAWDNCTQGKRTHLRRETPTSPQRKSPPLSLSGQCCVGQGFLGFFGGGSSICPSFDFFFFFLLSPSIRPVSVFRWLFVYTSPVRHHNLRLSRSIKGALAKAS